MDDNKIYLTYENFKRLSVITRIETGRPLAVIDMDAFKQEFPGRSDFAGVVGMFDGQVTRIPSESGYTTKDMTMMPAIANYCYGVSPFGPWLDYTQIPHELCFDFIVHHEIAHIKHGDVKLLEHLANKGIYTLDELHKSCLSNKMDKLHDAGEAIFYRCLTEYRADKYAWAKIFPGKDMPAEHVDGLPPGASVDKMIRNIQNLCRIHYDDLEKFKLGKVEPISLDPDEYVPRINAEFGLPIFDINHSDALDTKFSLWERIRSKIFRRG